ncbi:lumen targeted protein [Scenedesmus sp. NREL 46B-D3]|nr:lumen targeted protein [Scenedesmus sp. NREL 46B-D3]
MLALHSQGTLPRGAKPFAQARHYKVQPAAAGWRKQAAVQCGAAQPDVCSSSDASSSRRQALLAAAGSALAPAAASLLPQLAAAQPAAASAVVFQEAPSGFKALYDPTLAYKFMYPVQGASGKQLTMTLTRPPEKYSSAAPLSADARQRIVGELFDLQNGVLKDLPQQEWRPREVALTVLVDRSTARLSSGQRTALNDVIEAHTEERSGQTFYVYEHTSQGSPTVANPRAETYRHALAVTTTRPGLDGKPYLYTLNMSCPQSMWADMADGFKAAVDSFALVEPTNKYTAPDKNPWLFF